MTVSADGQVGPGVSAAGLACLGPQRAADVLGLIRAVPDYPSPGVIFRDITGLLADGEAFGSVIDAFAVSTRELGSIDLIAGIEARGFLLGAPLALRLGVGFLPLRKAGKLPPPTDAVQYALEYGHASIEMRTGTINSGERVLIVDDVLATGGTANAGAELVEGAGGVVLGTTFLLELAGLGGREKLTGRRVDSLLRVG